jgi:hypothetical protein
MIKKIKQTLIFLTRRSTGLQFRCAPLPPVSIGVKHSNGENLVRTVITCVLVVAIFLFLPVRAFAQSDVNNTHQMTAVPSDARFEIIQSQLAAKWTFRLDRYTGNVYQLVRTQSDGLAWEQMPVQGLPKIGNPTKPRFILFTSGIAARHTFLMDSNTGKTWVLTSVEVPIAEGKTSTINVWKPFEE